MAYGMTIHVIHVSGKRMIAQGTDGCSRGSLMEGVMTGQDMLLFVDLSRTAIERHPPVLDWVRSWTEMPNLEALTPEGWSRRDMASPVESWTGTMSGSRNMNQRTSFISGHRNPRWPTLPSKNF